MDGDQAAGGGWYGVWGEAPSLHRCVRQSVASAFICCLAGWVVQVMEAAGKHQVLIFVHSRKETAKTAR